MKEIINWRKASVFDTETDGLVDTLTKFHIIGIQLHGREEITLIRGDDHERINKMLDYHIENKIPIASHNGVMFDRPAMEKVLGRDLSDLMIIDTLALSWYLNVHHKSHSIETLSKDYPEAAEKFQIDEGGWENLSWEDAVNRVTADVEIGAIVWKDFKQRLIDMYTLSKEQIDAGNVGGTRTSPDEVIYLDSLKGLSVDEHVSRILTFLMYKMDVAALQERTRWKVDVEYLEESRKELSKLVEESATTLEAIMPPSPKYAARKPPKQPYKKNGELSASGERWENVKELLRSGERDEWGNLLAEVRKEGEIHQLTGYNPPNINSSQQVKDFLFSKGWRPQTFKYVRDNEAFEEWIRSKPEKGSFRGAWRQWQDSKPEDRAIPQITMDGEEGKELCESIVELAEQIPEIRALENYSIIKHRLGVVEGFFERMSDDGYLAYRVGGMTNTLRVRMVAPLTNLAASHKPYAEFIRGCLVAGEGNTGIYSDLDALENRVGHHYMLPLDPEYVAQMMSDEYDPHIDMAIKAGFITEGQGKARSEGTLEGEELEFVERMRSLGKTLNYSLIYGSGVSTIVRSTGLSETEATTARKAYWDLNWSVEAIAKEQIDIRSSDKRWLINPINGLLYNIRTDKDIFSTLIQGSGSYLFDMWSAGIIRKMKERWGKATMTAQFHK